MACPYYREGGHNDVENKYMVSLNEWTITSLTREHSVERIPPPKTVMFYSWLSREIAIVYREIFFKFQIRIATKIQSISPWATLIL